MLCGLELLCQEALKNNSIRFKMNLLKKYQHFMKLSDYSSEMEYRIMVKSEKTDGWFINRDNGILTPYIEKNIVREVEEDNIYPFRLSGIILGPAFREHIPRINQKKQCSVVFEITYLQHKLLLMEKRKERINNLEETPHSQRTVLNLQRIMTKPSIFRYEGHNYLVPFLIISSLFFMWGFAHGILEVLNPHFQESFHISKAMSALTQAAVYGAYFLMALPAGWIIRKWGYRRGVITGLVLFGIGALLFIPGSRINSFYFFVLSLFVIGCGLTCLETSANPYTTVLGHPDKAESRINLSQSLNGIGWIVGPLVGGQLLFSGVNIAIPYALVGIFVLAVALVLSRIKLPDPRRAHEVDTNEMVEEKPMRVMAFGFGMLTLFLYVAAQTGVNSFFINYAEESIHIEKQAASLYLAFGGMGLFFIGRLAGGVIMNYVQPRLVLLACAILTFVATLIVVVCSGTLSLIAFFALYLGESIMFPTIFSLALRDAGTKTKLASSLLIMTIVGGAVAPVIMGYIADTTGSMAIAFLIPLVCYGVIGGYALSNRHVPL